MPELGSDFLDTCSIQPSFGILGHIYPDFNASLVIVVIVKVPVVVLLTLGGGGGGWSELTYESYKDTLISGWNTILQ